MIQIQTFACEQASLPIYQGSWQELKPSQSTKMVRTVSLALRNKKGLIRITDFHCLLSLYFIYLNFGSVAGFRLINNYHHFNIHFAEGNQASSLRLQKCGPPPQQSHRYNLVVGLMLGGDMDRMKICTIPIIVLTA